MAWDVVSQTLNTGLPASKVNQLQDNFSALAAQNSGAPVVTFPNSILNANAGIGATGVASVGRLSVNGLVLANSGFHSTQAASVGLLDASSGAQVNVVAPAAPIAGRLYKDNIIRAWAACSLNATMASNMGVSAVANPSANIFVVTLATSFSTNRSWVPNGNVWDPSLDSFLMFDPTSQSGGSIALRTLLHNATASARGFTFWAVGS